MIGKDLLHNGKSRLSSNLSVAEVLDQWPQVIPVFFHHKLGCVGCAMAYFDTLEDVAKIYDLKLDHFMEDLRKATK